MPLLPSNQGQESGYTQYSDQVALVTRYWTSFLFISVAIMVKGEREKEREKKSSSLCLLGGKNCLEVV